MAQAVVLGLTLLLIQPVQGQANELEALDALQTLSLQNSKQAYLDLQRKAAVFNASPSIEIRRTYLSTLIGLASDTGHLEIAEAAEGQLSELARKHNDDIAFVLANGYQAHRLINSGDTTAAEALLDTVKPIALRSKSDEALWVYFRLMGSLHNTKGNFEEAMSNILKSIEHARKRPWQAESSLLRSCLEQVLTFLSMKNGDEALQVIAETRPLAQRLGATQILSALDLNRGIVESGLGHLDVALKAYTQALKTAQISDMVAMEAAALNNMGDIHLLRKSYAQAEPLVRQAKIKYLKVGDHKGAALSQANLGFAQMGLQHVDEGAAEVHAALAFLHQAGAKTTEEALLEELSRMYEQAGRFEEAMTTSRAQQKLSKELFQLDREQVVAKLRSQFDGKERQLEVHRLAQENLLKDAELELKRTQQVGLSASLLLLLAGSSVVVMLYQRTRKHNFELHQAKQLAEEALHEKNLFLATASHDLRQPVHAMSLMVEAISLRNKNAALMPLLEDLRSSMNTMSQLFNSLLDLSRLEAVSGSVNMVPVSLQSVIGEVIRELQGRAASMGLLLKSRMPRADATVLGDPLLLRQAMINLAQNAIRYTPNGKVLLSVRRRAGDWLIEVWDTGIGIADDEKATLFDPYVRSEKASHMDIAGHGLGLAVVARCARMMRAQYGFHSRLNKGSRFWLRLQAVNTQTSDEPAIGDLIPNRLSPLATRTPACAGVGQCLVIDDDHAVLIAWRTLLESWGLRVRTATNGFEANRILELGFVPQAIFCDHRLRQNESGFALLKSLLDRCPNASGAMVSGELASVELIEAEDQGYLVIKKPVSAATLHGMLCTWGLAHQSPSGVEHPLNGGHT